MNPTCHFFHKVNRLLINHTSFTRSIHAAIGVIPSRRLDKPEPCVCHLLQQRRTVSSGTYAGLFSPDFKPIGYAQDVFVSFHDFTGLPWWASIAVTTFTLRTCVTFPLTVYTNYVMAKVELLQPEIIELSKRLLAEVARATKEFNWSPIKAKWKFATTMKGLVRKLYIRDNCHPLKSSVIVIVQLPMWISLSIALRNMSGAMPMSHIYPAAICSSLQTEGVLWFTNLCAADSTFILPVTFGLLNLMNIEIFALTSKSSGKLKKYFTNGLRIISVAMVPVAGIVPSCVCFYWACSSLYGLMQNLLLRIPKFRRCFFLPPTPSESQTPFKDIYNLAKIKYGRKSK